MSQVKLDAPASNNTVRVRVIDTSSVMHLKASLFVKPAMPGHEMMNMPDLAFLIENDNVGKKALFDLGVRKDFWKLPPTIQARLDRLGDGLKVAHDVKDVLIEKNIPLESINDVIWSHTHWDHTGDITLFPSSTSLVYGPEVSSLKPGYPHNKESPLIDAYFQDRKNIEITFPDSNDTNSLKVGGFPAHDFYGDGSFYLLSCPGHAVGHLCALARTTPTTFILMGGDVCHFPGDLRPNKTYPMPTTLPSNALHKVQPTTKFPDPCPSAPFLKHHPQLSNPDSPLSKSKSNSSTDELDPSLSITPYYALSSSSYENPSLEVAQSTVATLTDNFDSNPNVFVMLAHDPALLPFLPTLNSQPEKDLNDWFEKGLKEACYWGWLAEVSRPEGLEGWGKTKEKNVEGFWRGGRRYGTAKALFEEFQREEGEKADGKL